MAQKELIRADYDSIKASLEKDSVNTVAKAFKVGNRRVALIKKSKSWNSYIALRAVERRKRAENTPAKAVAGAHDLADPEAEMDAFLDENGTPAPIEGEAAPEPANDPELDKLQDEISVESAIANAVAAEKAQQRATLLGLAIILGGVLIVLGLIVWGVIALITR